MTRLLLACAIVLWASVASAQVPANPTGIAFDHEDYATVDGYVLGYFSSATAPAPVQEAAFPKPASCMPCAGALVSRPTMFAPWWVAVRATAGTVTSDWSVRVPFVRLPLAPINVQVK